MFAATAAGIYEKVEDAMNAMGQGFDIEYRPHFARNTVYEKRYSRYTDLGTFLEQNTNL